MNLLNRLLAAAKHGAQAALMTALLACCSLGAQAAPLVTYDFSVFIDTQGTSVSGQTFLGSFSYDEAAGVPDNGLTRYALTAFSFDFAGNSYGLGDLLFADAVFDGSNLLGLDAVESTPVFVFTPGNGADAPYFAFDLGAGDAGNGSLDFALRPNPASLPSTLALLAAAAGLGLGRRRAAAAA